MSVVDKSSDGESEASLRENHARLVSAIDIGRMGHWDLSLSSLKLTASVHCRRNFGRSEQDPFDYEDLIACIHPEDRQRQQSAVKAAIETQSGFEVEYRFFTRTGELRWTQIRGRFESGDEPRIVGVSLDITERKLIEQVLLQNEERQTLLLKISDELRSLEDPDLIRTVSSQLLGHALSVDRCSYVEIDGTTLVRVGTGEYRAEFAHSLIGEHTAELFDALLMLGDGGRPVICKDVSGNLEIGLRGTACRARGIQAFVIAPLVKKVRVMAFMSLSMAYPRDWTDMEVLLLTEVAERTWSAVERARGEIARRDSEEKLRSADRQKDEFLAMLAHELRNPLAPIRLASELLGRIVPEGTREGAAVNILRRQSVQLTRLVDDLMDVSRITQGKIDLKTETVDLARVVAQAMEAIEPERREKNHELTLTSGFLPVHVNGDFARLVQCVSNVLANAAKYTTKNGKIRIEIQSEHAEAIIKISDSGFGISPELLPKIFDLFVQSDQTLDRAQGGLGIGLSVVKRLIEMHGGVVIAASAGPGLGSTFEFRLPRVDPSPLLPAKNAGSTRVRRVLIVDDNRDAADSLAMLLQSSGHTVEAVYSGADALARIEMFEPDILLLDLGLPEINGFELARKIRGFGKWKATQLIAVTGYGQPEDRERTQAAGFDGHLIKPVDLEVLERIIWESAAGLKADPDD